MAASCYFCQKKIGLLESSYDIDGKRFSQKICYECDSRKRVLQRLGKGDYSKAYDFFSKLKTKEDIDVLVRETIDSWIMEGNERQAQRDTEQQKKDVITQAISDFPMTTGYNFEGYRILGYKGVISGATVLGTGLLSDLSAVVSDAFGLHSVALEEKIIEARTTVKDKLVRQALEMGGTGLIGIDYDLSVLAGNTIAILGTGTVVAIEKDVSDTNRVLEEIEANLPEM